jgi:hypothetical protein
MEPIRIVVTHNNHNGAGTYKYDMGRHIDVSGKYIEFISLIIKKEYIDGGSLSIFGDTTDIQQTNYMDALGTHNEFVKLTSSTFGLIDIGNGYYRYRSVNQITKLLYPTTHKREFNFHFECPLLVETKVNSIQYTQLQIEDPFLLEFDIIDGP